jgi:acetyltransferase
MAKTKKEERNLSGSASADTIVNAKSFAVIGAAREEYKVGFTIFKNLLQCKEIKVFPVNPKADKILEQKCYSSVLDIEEKIDCAIIVVKSDITPEVLKQCGKKQVKSVVIISAGFSEIGSKGIELEQEIVKICEKNNIAMLGPNILGFINPYKGINASFFDGIPEKGNIAFLSQSGALGVAVLDWAMKEKLGLSGFISLGNSAMMDCSDFIEYYSKDSNTKVIALYLESLKENQGKRFLEVCKNLPEDKRIIAIKSGKTQRGSQAALSHTAALASEQGIYESVFKQAGVIEVNSITELFETARLFLKFPKKLGRRACIVTNAGGLGVLCTDACEKQGIEIPKLHEDIIEKLNKILPENWSHNNPIDILGDALQDRYNNTLKLLDKEDFFDYFIILLTPQYMTKPLETAQILTQEKITKPVLTCFLGGNKINDAIRFLKQNNIPCFSDVSELAEVASRVCC